MLLDEQAVTCYVALPPAGVQSLRYFQIRVADLCANCISPYLRHIYPNQLYSTPSTGSTASRGDKSTEGHEAMKRKCNC